MTKPVRLQLLRRKGMSLQVMSGLLNGLEAVNVARPSKWGNPFYVGGYHKIGPRNSRAGFSRLTALDEKYADASFTHVTTNEQAVAMFRRYCEIWENPSRFAALKGKNLGCWCKISHDPYTPCHADVLLSLANDIPMEEIINENIRRSKGETAS
jgi:hypothetical protein